MIISRDILNITYIYM